MRKWIRIALVLLFVLVSVVYFASACAPAPVDGAGVPIGSQPLDPNQYVGRYLDNEYGYVCYFTRYTPTQMQCFPTKQ